MFPDSFCCSSMHYHAMLVQFQEGLVLEVGVLCFDSCSIAVHCDEFEVIVIVGDVVASDQVPM